MANGIALERAVANIEMTFSKGAIIPVLGSIAAAWENHFWHHPDNRRSSCSSFFFTLLYE